MDGFEYRLETWRKQASMVRHAVRHLTAPSVRDWVTSRGHVGTTLGRWFGDDMEAMQRPNAEVAFVSTPADGVGAGLTASGRLSVLVGPSTGGGHLSPYYVDGSDGPLLGADPMAGQFAGLAADGDDPEWLWERPATVRYDGPGAVRASHDPASGRGADGPAAAPPLSVTSETFVVPGTGTLVRQYSLANPGDQARTAEFVYHARANVNEGLQTFGVWNSSPNELEAAGGLHWQDRTSGLELRVRLDRSATALARTPGGEFAPGRATGSTLEGRLRTDLEVPPGETVDVAALVAVGESPTWDSDLLDAAPGERRRRVSEWWDEWLPGDLPTPEGTDPDAAGSGPDVQEAEGTPTGDAPGSPEGGGAATGGADAIRAAPGSSASDSPGPEVDAAGPPVAGEADAAADGRASDATLARIARRSVAVLGALSDPASGSLSASPNLQPTYYPCWPRDAAFGAVALARVGAPGPPRRLLADFLPSVQEDDGRFRQCYDSAGRYAGVVDVEADQQPQYAWAVREVAAAVDDPAFVEAAWPAVRDALLYTVESVEDDGLLEPTPDIDEYPDSVRQSLWTNAWAFRGLRDGAALASVVGEDPEPYRRAAAVVGSALEAEFFGTEPYVTCRDAGGDHHEPHPYDAVALSPTGWAEEYGVADRVERDMRELAGTDHSWVPGRFLLAAALFRRGATVPAEDLLRRTAALQTSGGHLVEVPGDGVDHHFASPLGWSHAAFLLAMEARGVA